jgi:hypothetical protein
MVRTIIQVLPIVVAVRKTIGHRVAIVHPVDVPSQEILLAAEAGPAVPEPAGVLRADKVKIGRTNARSVANAPLTGA